MDLGQPPDQLRALAPNRDYSIRTERIHVHWPEHSLRWHGTRRPRQPSARGTEAFLTHLTAERPVSVSPHYQASSAILFMHREVGALLAAMPQPLSLVARLLYGTGMRPRESLPLRVKYADLVWMAELTPTRRFAGGQPRLEGGFPRAACRRSRRGRRRVVPVFIGQSGSKVVADQGGS